MLKIICIIYLKKWETIANRDIDNPKTPLLKTLEIGDKSPKDNRVNRPPMVPNFQTPINSPIMPVQCYHKQMQKVQATIQKKMVEIYKLKKAIAQTSTNQALMQSTP